MVEYFTMSKESLEAFNKTLDFLCDPEVSSVPIGKRSFTPPLKGNQTPGQWGRMYSTLGEYLGTDSKLEEIGKKNGSTREGVRQAVKRATGNLWQAQTDEVKKKHPIEEFGYHKPITRLGKVSENHGGPSYRVRQLLSEGKTLDEIKGELTQEQISQSRQVLEKYGIDVPYQKRSVRPKFKRLKVPGISDEEKQKLLERIRNLHDFKTLSLGSRPLIIDVLDVAEQAGFAFGIAKAETIFDLLRRNGVPASSFSEPDKEKGDMKTYYFISANDFGRSMEIVRSLELSDEEKKDFLTGITNHGLLSTRRSLVESVLNIAEQTGLFLPAPKAFLVYEVLQKNGIPVSSFSQEAVVKGKKRVRAYRFICKADVERATNVIKAASELDVFRTNPVVALRKVPTVGEIINSGHYSTVSPLIEKMVGERFYPHYRTEDIFEEDCPVVIFRYRDSLFYSKTNEAELKAYLLRRLRELGKI